MHVCAAAASAGAAAVPAAETLLALLAAGADPAARTRSGKTAAQLAAEHRSWAALHVLQTAPPLDWRRRLPAAGGRARLQPAAAGTLVAPAVAEGGERSPLQQVVPLCLRA